jgi:hypothetical protein
MRFQVTRRQIFVGALLALVAVLGAVGDGQIASAEPRKVDGYGSREAFERACARQGGTLSYGLGGELACRLDKGSIICDHQGNNCWFYPSSPRNAGADEGDEAVVLGTGGLPGKTPGTVNSVDIPIGPSGSGDIDVGTGDIVAAP